MAAQPRRPSHGITTTKQYVGTRTAPTELVAKKFSEAGRTAWGKHQRRFWLPSTHVELKKIIEIQANHPKDITIGNH